jgi:hypothetical protein
MTDPNPIPPLWQAVLNAALARCAAAGFGRVETSPTGDVLFEAYPGQEDAAADFVEALLIGRSS